jgi:hypothetical protein
MLAVEDVSGDEESIDLTLLDDIYDRVENGGLLEVPRIPAERMTQMPVGGMKNAQHDPIRFRGFIESVISRLGHAASYRSSVSYGIEEYWGRLSSLTSHVGVAGSPGVDLICAFSVRSDLRR